METGKLIMNLSDFNIGDYYFYNANMWPWEPGRKNYLKIIDIIYDNSMDVAAHRIICQYKNDLGEMVIWKPIIYDFIQDIMHERFKLATTDDIILFKLEN